VLTCNVER